MNISRGKIKKLRRSKSQSRKKAPKKKKKKRPRTGQNRSFRKKNYINLKNGSLKKLGKKKRRIRFQKGGDEDGDGDGDGVDVLEIASKIECEDQGKKWNPDTKECEQKADTEQTDIATGAEQNVSQIQNSDVGDTLNRNNCHNVGQEYDEVTKNCKKCDEDNGKKYNPETKKCEGDVEGDAEGELAKLKKAFATDIFKVMGCDNAFGNCNTARNKAKSDLGEAWWNYNVKYLQAKKAKTKYSGGEVNCVEKVNCDKVVKRLNKFVDYINNKYPYAWKHMTWYNEDKDIERIALPLQLPGMVNKKIIKKVFWEIVEGPSNAIKQKMNVQGYDITHSEYPTPYNTAINKLKLFVSNKFIQNLKTANYNVLTDSETDLSRLYFELPLELSVHKPNKFNGQHLLKHLYPNLKDVSVDDTELDTIIEAAVNSPDVDTETTQTPPDGTNEATQTPPDGTNEATQTPPDGTSGETQTPPDEETVSMGDQTAPDASSRKYSDAIEKTKSSKSKIETYVNERGKLSLGKTPTLTLYKFGNRFKVKYRYPFIPKEKLDLDYSTEMNISTLKFNPSPIWNDKPKPSKRSLIPGRTKHDEATYVKVKFNLNLKAHNKSRMQKFVLRIPKLSLTFSKKITEVKLQFKDLYEPENNKIIRTNGNNKEVIFSQAIDIVIPATQECVVNNMDSGVHSSLQSIQHRQNMEANQRINKLKVDLSKSKMNEGDATLCTNKIRDMEADLLENNAMTISYDPASKNVYVSKVENLTDFAESLKINLDELHDTDTQDPIVHQSNVDSNTRTTQMVKDKGMDKTIMSKSPTIQTPSFIKKKVTPTPSNTISTSTETVPTKETSTQSENASTTPPDAKTETSEAEKDKTDDSSKASDNTDNEVISIIASDIPDAETQNKDETTIPDKKEV